MGRTPASCGLCFSMSRIASLTALPDVRPFGQREQVIEPRVGREVEDAFGVIGGGVVDARATTR